MSAFNLLSSTSAGNSYVAGAAKSFPRAKNSLASPQRTVTTPLYAPLGTPSCTTEAMRVLGSLQAPSSQWSGSQTSSCLHCIHPAASLEARCRTFHSLSMPDLSTSLS